MSVLHLVIQNIRFNRPIVKPSDEIRVSFTTLPNHQKGNISVPGSKIYFINQELSMSIDSFTKEVLIIIRRKSYINGDPILGKVLFLIESLPRDQEINKELDVLDIIPDTNKVLKIGTMSVRGFFDNQVSTKRQINSSYSTSTLSEIPAFDLLPNHESNSFFQNMASKFQRKPKFVGIEDGNSFAPVQHPKGKISGSKSEYLFVDPLD